MELWHRLQERLTAEHLGWFGAGLCAAVAALLSYQFITAAVFGSPLPGPQPNPVAAAVHPTASPTSSRTSTPSPTARPTSTPLPTRTPRPSPTPTPTPGNGVAAVVATLSVAEPDVVVGVVATFAARTNAALQPLVATAGTRP
jgi:hypothetical protein